MGEASGVAESIQVPRDIGMGTQDSAIADEGRLFPGGLEVKLREIQEVGDRCDAASA
jgi:hypothetical protein